MLFSRAGQIAFAHYPKTAGCSLTAWFRERFPDAAYVEPRNCHMPVRTSLEGLGLVTARPRRNRLVRNWLRLVGRVAPRLVAETQRVDLRIIGVVREPFEMLVSLYEYWRRYEFSEEPEAELIRTARTGTFREFLSVAVGDGHLANYETYFDVGGPAWQTTRLIDFQALEPGLAQVCEEFGIEPPATLERLNAAPRQRRDLGDYLAQAGSLVFEVRSHFRWYYEEAAGIMIRGRRTTARRAA
ncbi:MAG: hypothetical protein ACKOCX_13680 [Planctomycetota bacterium]